MSTPIRREALSLNIAKKSHPLPQEPKGKIDRVSESFFLDPKRISQSIAIPQKTTRIWKQIDTRTSIAIPGVAAKTLSPFPAENMSVLDSSFAIGTPPQPAIFHCELESTPESEEETLPLSDISSKQIEEPQRIGRYAKTKGKENVPPIQPSSIALISPATGKRDDFSIIDSQSDRDDLTPLDNNIDQLQFPFEDF